MALRVCLYNLTTGTQVGGVETFVAELARQLARLGHQPVIVAGYGDRILDIPGCQLLRFPFVSRAALRRIPPFARAYAFTKLLERLSFALWAVPALSRERFDVIHIQKPYDLVAGALLKERCGAVLILGSHGRDFFLGDRLFVRWVDGATACSSYNAEEALVARYGVLGTVVYNGVDVEHFKYRPDPLLRDQLLRGQKHLALTVGRLVRWKGVDTVLRAVAALRERGLKVAVAVAGDGPDRRTLEGLAQELGIAKAATFLGNVGRDVMPALMSSADLLMAGSFANETFGIALAEAMACERPVVATSFGGFAEVVHHGITGLLVPPRDYRAMAMAAQELLLDPVRLAQFGRAARLRVEELFTWEAVAQRVLKVYADALDRRGKVSRDPLYSVPDKLNPPIG